MDRIDEISVVANMIGSVCSLNHEDDRSRKAVNSLIQKFGDKDSFHLTVPICSECEEAILGNEWVLLYCVNCNNSQWVLKELAKLTYNNSVMWLDRCPKCK